MQASRHRDDAMGADLLSAKERAPILLACGLVVLGALALMFWYFHPLLSAQYDDSYITYRYAWNLFQGDGLVFNPGDRVNSASSLLFVLVLAALGPLGHDALPLASTVIGVVSYIGAGAVFVATGLHLRRSALGLLVGLGAASIVLINATNAYWALSGMETALFNLLLATSLVLATLPDARRPEMRLAALTMSLVLLTLARPEGIAIAGAVAVGWAIRAALSHDRHWVAAATPSIAVSATAAGYLIFNVVYYGTAIPNSVLFKTLSDYYTTSLSEDLASLVIYLGMRIGPLVLVVAIGGLAAALIWGRGSARARLARLLPGVLGGLALLAFLLITSYSDQYRYQTPLSIFAAWSAVQWAAADRLMSRRHALRWTTGVLLVLLGVGAVWQVLVAERLRATVAPFFTVQEERQQMGEWLEANSPPETRVLAGDLGSLAFWNPSNTYIDSSGLTNAQLLQDLVAGMPYSTAIARQTPELLVDTVSPGGVAGTMEVFDRPGEYFDPESIQLPPGRGFESVYLATRLDTPVEQSSKQLSVAAWRLERRDSSSG